MYLPSPYAIPYGSFQTPVAIPQTAPDVGPFFYIPINCDWMPLIAGALKQLLLQATWATDDPDALQTVQGQVFNLISLFNCATALSLADICGSMGAEGDDCMGCCLRFNNGVLQQLECGVWTDVPGQPGGGLYNPQQPGEGSTQPPAGGGCQQYNGTLQANGRWLVPTVVSTGDTIEIGSAMGATNDGAGLRWYCPDGPEFFAGGCIGTLHLDGSDPMPSAGHMRVIANINGTYYDAMSGPIVVGSGVTNAQVYLQVNDSDLTDNAGAITLAVTACNNQLANWTKTVDLKTTPFGFVVDFAGAGNWSPTDGWEGECYHNLADTTYYRLLQIHRAISSVSGCRLNQIQIGFNQQLGTFVSPNINSISVNGTQVTSWSPANGNGQIIIWNGDVATPTSIEVGLVASQEVASGCSDASENLYTLVLSGKGPEPVW